MVDRCPSGTSFRLAQKCEKTVTGERYKYSLDIPVVSEDTGLVYANKYCAKCHDDNTLQHHNSSIICNCDLESKFDLMDMDYQSGELAWTSDINENENCLAGAQMKACLLSISYPNDIGRLCENNNIGTCPSNWPDPSDAELCESYNYYVQDHLSNVYKNPTCARCNEVPPAAIHCLSPSISIRFGDERGLDVFLLSDLFTVNDACYENQEYDFIFENCVEDEMENCEWCYMTTVLFLILLSISLGAMVLHMVMFFILYKHRSLHTKNLFSMICSLFWAEFLLVICSRSCSSEVGCYISTVIVYFCFMASFFWMNVMSFDVCKTFRSQHRRSKSHRVYIKYAIYAFGGPLMLTLVAVIVNELAPNSAVAPGFGTHGFWFSKRGGLLLFFCGPALFIFIANLAMLGVSIYDIFQKQKDTQFAMVRSQSVKSKNKRAKKEADAFINDNSEIGEAANGKDASKLNQLQDKIKEGIDKVTIDKDRMILYLKLALIMGVPWIFALFDNVSSFCLYVFNILNSLQGLFIFIAFDCKPKFLAEVCERFGWHKLAESLATSSTTSSSLATKSNQKTSSTAAED